MFVLPGKVITHNYQHLLFVYFSHCNPQSQHNKPNINLQTWVNKRLLYSCNQRVVWAGRDLRALLVPDCCHGQEPGCTDMGMPAFQRWWY